MNDEMIALVAPDTTHRAAESGRVELLRAIRALGVSLALSPRQFTAACGDLLLFNGGADDRTVTITHRFDHRFEFKLTDPSLLIITIQAATLEGVIEAARRAGVIA